MYSNAARIADSYQIAEPHYRYVSRSKATADLQPGPKSGQTNALSPCSQADDSVRQIAPECNAMRLLRIA